MRKPVLGAGFRHRQADGSAGQIRSLKKCLELFRKLELGFLDFIPQKALRSEARCFWLASKHVRRADSSVG
jgi:hypothetical protein